MTGATQFQRRMLEAHATGDVAKLPLLYLEAAHGSETQGEVDAACFFFTHAYVYALDAGDDAIAEQACAKLKSHGRDR